jgi:signal transduction histidine kinase
MREEVAEQKEQHMTLEENRVVESSKGELESLTSSLLSALEAERKRLARGLHEDLNQRLAALALQAGILENRLQEDARAQLRDMRQELESLSDDMRRLAHDLHPTILEHFGLVAALRSFCGEISHLGRSTVSFRQRNVPASIPYEVALCLYRVAQEFLAGRMKHSLTTTAVITLAGASSHIQLAISDDGAGFDTAAEPEERRIGMVTMRERVRLAGGTLSVMSRPEGGSRLEVRIPLAGSAI